MKYRMFDDKDLENLKEYAYGVGSSYLILGILGVLVNIIFPSIPLDFFAGAILFISGIASFYFAFTTAWNFQIKFLQPAILFVSSFVLLAIPTKHALVLLLSMLFYLFLDGFVKLLFSQAIRPISFWSYISYSGAFSIVLALSILIGWEFMNNWLLALLISLNILFDGIMLFLLSKRITL